MFYCNADSRHSTHVHAVSLVPVNKDKTGQISSIENYSLIILARVMFTVLEIIIQDQFQQYVITNEEQFVFKSKHRTDMYSICFERGCEQVQTTELHYGPKSLTASILESHL